MKTELTVKLTALALAMALTTLSTAAFSQTATGGAAGDGVITTDPSKATTGSVTPGDIAGFPITIGQSGSYRLTGNLLVTEVGVTAIHVIAPNVTIDMNGFSLVGPNQCTWSPKSCTLMGQSASGVCGTCARLTLHAGLIEGVSSAGAWATGGVFGDLSLQQNGYGLYSSTVMGIENVRARFNSTTGIQVGNEYATVRNAQAVMNFGTGISLAGGLVLGSMAQNNGHHGVSAQGSAVVVGVRESVLTTNGYGAFGGSISMGNNLCSGKVPCRGSGRVLARRRAQVRSRSGPGASRSGAAKAAGDAMHATRQVGRAIHDRVRAGCVATTPRRRASLTASRREPTASLANTAWRW